MSSESYMTSHSRLLAVISKGWRRTWNVKKMAGKEVATERTRVPKRGQFENVPSGEGDMESDRKWLTGR